MRRSALRILRYGLPAGCLAVCFAATSAAAQTFTVRGQITSQTDRSPLPGISVILTGRSLFVTDTQGRFVIPDVSRGRYTVFAQGIGYETADTVITVISDTTIELRLKTAPVDINALNVRARNVTVRGVVRERATDNWVIDANVFGTPDKTTHVDLAGRFKISKVPSGIPFSVQVESFGFLPSVHTFEPQNDTTIRVNLEPDPVATRMIANLEKKMDERSDGHRYKYFSTMERDQWLKARDEGLFLDVLYDRVGMIVAKRVACIVLDEVFHPRRGDPLGTAREKLKTILADEVHRIELVELPGPRRPIMIRVYTRGFMQDLVNGKRTLVEEEKAMKNLGKQCQ